MESDMYDEGFFQEFDRDVALEQLDAAEDEERRQQEHFEWHDLEFCDCWNDIAFPEHGPWLPLITDSLHESCHRHAPVLSNLAIG